MHACGNTKQVKSRAKAMKSKDKIRNTVRNTSNASKERWQLACGTDPAGPTRPLSAPPGPTCGASRRWNGESRPMSAPLGPCGAE